MIHLSRVVIDLITLAVFTPPALLGGAYVYAYLDSAPPWVRLSGTIDPTHAGESFTPHWHTTPLVRDCPGTLQIEIISSQAKGPPLIWPVLQRTVSRELHTGQTEYDPPPWPLDRDIPPGSAIYRVTSFWYCNQAQKSVGLPIIQVGPDIPFEVLPEKKR